MKPKTRKVAESTGENPVVQQIAEKGLNALMQHSAPDPLQKPIIQIQRRKQARRGCAC